MTLTTNSVRFEMVLDEQTYAAFTVGHTPWRSPDAAPWECPGIEPSIFSDGYVPFKWDCGRCLRDLTLACCVFVVVVVVLVVVVVGGACLRRRPSSCAFLIYGRLF